MNLVSNKSSDILALTGLRFFAAFSVIMAHSLVRIMSVPNTIPTWLIPFNNLSAEGMTLFFILSGFVIHYNYSKSLNLNPKIGIYNFMIARFARLWPLYMVCILVALTIAAVRAHELPSHFLSLTPYYLTLTQSWFYRLFDGRELIYLFGTMPAVTWSISTEWFFYFCYPIIGLFILNRSNLRKNNLLLASTLIVVTAISAIIGLYSDDITAHAISAFGVADLSISLGNHSFLRWLIYVSPYSRIAEFFVGCLLADSYMRSAQEPVVDAMKPSGLLLTLLALSGVLISHYCLFTQFTWDNIHLLANLQECFGFVPSMALFIYCCTRYNNIIVRVLSNPLVLIGGEISYSIYLLHEIVIGLIFNMSAKIAGYSLAKLLTMLILTILLSLVTYRYIEIPARNKIRRKLSIKKVVANPAPAHY